MLSVRDIFLKFIKIKTLALFFMVLTSFPEPSYSACSCDDGCSVLDCESGAQEVSDYHDEIEDKTKENFDKDLQAFEKWMIDTLLKQHVGPAMAAMATQMTAVSTHYTQMVGAFLDAQMQLSSQRVFRRLQFEAHADYRPSEDFCYFGTNVGSLAATDNKARYNNLALSRLSIARGLGSVNVSGAESSDQDYAVRWNHFVKTYCDRRDNNFQNTGNASDDKTGLSFACENTGTSNTNHNRMNRDIDYARLIEKNRTLEVDFTDSDLRYDKTGFNTIPAMPSSMFLGYMQSGDEEDILTLSQNLYGNKIISRELADTKMQSYTAQRLYLALRGVAAKRNVAQATFNAIVALKSAGTTETSRASTPSLTHPTGATMVIEQHQTRRYMLAIMEQLIPSSPNLTAGSIFDIIGYSPSYYAQLEILAKRIYQNPDFYANLYDTPTNVKRKRVAMKAIELMVDRTIYESQLRREMSISVLLASKLRPKYRDTNKSLEVGSTKN